MRRWIQIVFLEAETTSPASIKFGAAIAKYRVDTKTMSSRELRTVPLNRRIRDTIVELIRDSSRGYYGQWCASSGF